MKNTTWNDIHPQTKEEYKVEIDRLFAETEQMLGNARRNNEEAALISQRNAEAIRWMQEKMDVG